MPKVFISYSWEKDNKNWVKNLAELLKKEHIDVIYDQQDLLLGQDLPGFMENSIRNSDYVLIICTPEYKRKAEAEEKSGVRYEESIIRMERFVYNNEHKFITILKEGTANNAIPYQLQSKYYLDLSQGLDRIEILTNTIKHSFPPESQSQSEYLEEYIYEDGLEMDTFDLGGAYAPFSILHGYKDANGNTVIPTTYEYLQSFSYGLAAVARNYQIWKSNVPYWRKKYGYINLKNELVVPYQYDAASIFRYGMALVGKENEEGQLRYGFINTDCVEVIPLQYEILSLFFDGRALFGKSENGIYKYGYIDMSGKEVIPPIYDDANVYREGMAVVRMGEGSGAIDINGLEKVQLKYHSVYDFKEGFARVVDRYGKYGYVNKLGYEVVFCQYDFADDVENGRAHVMIDEKWFYINMSKPNMLIIDE